jgi:metal-dependent amidase/aminoacylase/carboxypeptidase family protein
MRETFLKEHHHAVFSAFLMDGTLKQHLLDIQEQANERMETLTKQMAKAEGVTEQLKAEAQMDWVRKMNSIRYRAEEMVTRDLIYTL